MSDTQEMTRPRTRTRIIRTTPRTPRIEAGEMDDIRHRPRIEAGEMDDW